MNLCYGILKLSTGYILVVHLRLKHFCLIMKRGFGHWLTLVWDIATTYL